MRFTNFMKRIFAPGDLRLGPKKVQTTLGPNFLNTYRILMICASLESPQAPLSNGAKIIKIRHVLRKLGPIIVGAFLGPDRKNPG